MGTITSRFAGRRLFADLRSGLIPPPMAFGFLAVPGPTIPNATKVSSASSLVARPLREDPDGALSPSSCPAPYPRRGESRARPDEDPVPSFATSATGGSRCRQEVDELLIAAH